MDQQVTPSFLAKLVEEQKHRKNKNHHELIQGMDQSSGLIIDDQTEDNLNVSVPEKFEFRKFEDSVNEKRPTL